MAKSRTLTKATEKILYTGFFALIAYSMAQPDNLSFTAGLAVACLFSAVILESQRINGPYVLKRVRSPKKRRPKA